MYKDDPANYRKMSEPFENPDKCNEALEAFNNEVGELRKKYNIRDVVVVCKGNVLYPEKGEGNEAQYMLHFNYGNILEVESMLAHAFGKAQAEQRELINTALAK